VILSFEFIQVLVQEKIELLSSDRDECCFGGAGGLCDVEECAIFDFRRYYFVRSYTSIFRRSRAIFVVRLPFGGLPCVCRTVSDEARRIAKFGKGGKIKKPAYAFSDEKDPWTVVGLRPTKPTIT
jgi:hypothetical protein